MASVPNVLVMNVEFAQKNKIEKLAGLIDYAKKNPGKLNYGSGGNGSAGHLSGELLKARAGISVEHIPYQGAAPAQLALLSGQSDFMFDNLAASAPLIKDGKVKALAVTTAKRPRCWPTCPPCKNPASRASTWAPGSASSPRAARLRRWSPS